MPRVSEFTNWIIKPLDLQRACAAAIAGMGWFALMVHIYLDIDDALTHNESIAASLIRFFSFFTIQTNLLVAMILTLSLMRPQPERFLTRPSVKSALATYIIIVGVVYALMLRHLWHPEGLRLVADHALHDAVPLLYPLYWLFFMPKGNLRRIDPLLWLIYPVIYFIYLLMTGVFLDAHLYPFLDAAKLGYAAVMYNAVLLLAAFFALGVTFAAIDYGVAVYKERRQSRLGRAAEL